MTPDEGRHRQTHLPRRGGALHSHSNLTRSQRSTLVRRRSLSMVPSAAYAHAELRDACHRAYI